MEGSLFLSVAASMEAKQTLDQIDDTADSMVEIIRDVQLKMSMLHTTVGDLMNSMAVTLNSMADMKDSLSFPQPPTESLAMVDQIQDLPASPTKQSSIVLDNDKPIHENKNRYIELKKIQVEIPVFVGLNVNMWIMKAERYFGMGNFTETEKVQLAYLSMEEAALSWFNFWMDREPFLDWDDFKSRLLKRFGGLNSESAFERLLSLKQEESVIDYLSQFEELASLLQSKDFSGSTLECLFVKGLREEIQDMIRLFQPKGLDNIIAMARCLESSPFCRVPDASSEPTDAINKQLED